jgi:hypothetical protein
MQLSADSGLLLAIFSAEPGSRSAQTLDLLATCAATPEHIQAAGETLNTQRGKAGLPLSKQGGSSRSRRARFRFAQSQ